MAFLRRNKTTVGLDIGSGLVKAAVVDHGRGAPALVKVAVTPLAADAIVDGEIMDPALVAEAVRETLVSAGVKPKGLVVSVGGRDVIVKRIRTERVMVGAHILCSLMAGLTGLYLASRLRAGAPWVGRDGVYDLESIAVVVIGGTLLAGGRGGVWGTLAGVFLFATLDAVFNMTGIDAFPKQVLRGAIVILAVAVYAVRSKGHVA